MDIQRFFFRWPSSRSFVTNYVQRMALVDGYRSEKDEIKS